MNDTWTKTKLDKIDLMRFKTSRDAPEKILFQHTILDAANNYLYFGLAKRNGTSAKEFYFAYEYFYRVRSYDIDSWKESRSVKVTAIDETLNKRTTRVNELTDEQIKAMCFDMHFSISNIRLSMDTFLRKLKYTRKLLVDENWNQINTYINSLHTQNHDTINLIDVSERKRILVSPESLEEIAKLFNIQPPIKKIKGIHGTSSKNVSNVGNCCDV